MNLGSNERCFCVEDRYMFKITADGQLKQADALEGPMPPCSFFLANDNILFLGRVFINF